jgi:hypothetical protein
MNASLKRFEGEALLAWRKAFARDALDVAKEIFWLFAAVQSGFIRPAAGRKWLRQAALRGGVR